MRQFLIDAVWVLEAPEQSAIEKDLAHDIRAFLDANGFAPAYRSRVIPPPARSTESAAILAEALALERAQVRRVPPEDHRTNDLIRMKRPAEAAAALEALRAVPQPDRVTALLDAAPAPPPAEVEAALVNWWKRHPDLAHMVSGEWRDLLATVTALVDAERERCAEIAGRFAENYPAAVFSAPDARELVLIADHERLRFLSDRLGADMARRTSANIATAIRQAPRP